MAKKNIKIIDNFIGKVKNYFIKQVFLNNLIENFYHSLRLSVKNKFKRIFFSRDIKLEDKKIDLSKIIIYDWDIHRKLVFTMPSHAKKLITQLFYNNNYLLYRNDILDILKKKIPGEKINILDLGANIGTFSIYYYYFLSFHLKRKISLYLFEPLPYNLRLLKDNLLKNQIKEYKIFPNAVCEKSNAYIDLFIGGSITGCTIIKNEKYSKEQATEKIRVRSLKIDDLKLKNIDLVKLDIEGAEELALKGMKKTISSNTPIVICSYEHQTNNKDSIIKLINNYGNYEYKDDRKNSLLYFMPLQRFNKHLE